MSRCEYSGTDGGRVLAQNEDLHVQSPSLSARETKGSSTETTNQIRPSLSNAVPHAGYYH